MKKNIPSYWLGIEDVEVKNLQVFIGNCPSSVKMQNADIFYVETFS